MMFTEKFSRLVFRACMRIKIQDSGFRIHSEYQRNGSIVPGTSTIANARQTYTIIPTTYTTYSYQLKKKPFQKERKKKEPLPH